MIDIEALQSMLRTHGLSRWADAVAEPLQQVLEAAPHGDWPRWLAAIDALPDIAAGQVGSVDGAWTLTPDVSLDRVATDALHEALMQLHPWRKGPFRIGDLKIDTEWRSDWKWDRLAAHVESLDGRLVLDVGCGNGYHCWRIAEAGARQVIGIDPTAVFLAQFLALRKLMTGMRPTYAGQVALLPLGIEALPPRLRGFDTVFSMGVLYHRRSPVDHLLELRGALRDGGQLVLETLVVEGRDDRVLVPEGRYAKMRNVWFIPTTAGLENWIRRAGFKRVETVDVTPTSVEEQRSTGWMTFESLADFLDPADSRLTIEGYPAPRRAILIANA